MSTTNATLQNRIGSEVRHTKEDALDEREFEYLLEGARKMRDYYGFQARFIILVGGRLGLRRAEIAHMREEWVDWRRRMIVVPRHEECHKGRDGGPCGYCRNQAKQMVEHNDGVSYEEAIKTRWAAKTDAAAREIPFDFDPRVELVIERFFDGNDEFPTSCQSINRRINKAAALSPELDPENIYPHALRGSAATYHAGRGLDVLALQSMFGWASLQTAQVYIKSSGENTARALHSIHSR